MTTAAELSPLQEIERRVQLRAKETSLDMADDGRAKLRSLIDDEVAACSDALGSAPTPAGGLVPGLGAGLVEEGTEHTLHLGPIRPAPLGARAVLARGYMSPNALRWNSSAQSTPTPRTSILLVVGHEQRRRSTVLTDQSSWDEPILEATVTPQPL